MGYREEYEAEIDLKDMLFYVLRRWRSILLAGLVLCVLLGGYRIVRNILAFSGENTETDIEMDMEAAYKEYEEALAAYELDKSDCDRDMAYYQKLLDRQEVYMEKSVLMHVDAFREPVAYADVLIKLEDEEWEGLPDNIGIDPTDAILKAYVSFDWGKLEEASGMEKEYLEEIINCTVDYSCNTFRIAVIHWDADMAMQMLDTVMKVVMERGQEEGIGRHTAMLLNRVQTYSVDKNLLSNQKSNAEAVSSYERSLLDCQKRLEALVEPRKPEKPESIAKKQVTFNSSFIKYCVIGFFLGVFLLVVVYGCSYIFGGKLHGETELRCRYGYHLLGTFAVPQENKTLRCIDKFLSRLEGKSCQAENRQVCRHIAMNIINLAEENAKLLLTGNVDIARLQVLAGELAPQIGKITLSVAENSDQNADALKMLADCDAVVLVEEREKSLVSEVQKEQENIMAFKKPVIGYVML